MNSGEYKERKNLIYSPWVWIVSIILCAYGIGIILLIVLLGLMVYSHFYFKGEQFNSIKSNISKYIDDCNNLNDHIEELKRTYVNVTKTDYGEAEFKNISRYNYKKSKLNASFAPNIYDCSRSVCANAQKQPFKYICKYFNIKPTEETLAQIEEAINNFSAAEEGKALLNNKKNEILESIKNDIPWAIRSLFAKNLDTNLGFKEIAFNEFYFPRYTFRYISSGGNAGTQFTTTMDIPMLERFSILINDGIKRRKSAAGQRALMTSSLRIHIKERDHYTCKKCKNSTNKEPNLLLEIDHIIPIAKGGLTEESNLQTLCWKCNRSKGAKIN